MLGFDGKIKGERISEGAFSPILQNPDAEDVFNHLFKDDFAGIEIEKSENPTVYDATDTLTELFSDDFDGKEKAENDETNQNFEESDTNEVGKDGERNKSDISEAPQYDEDGTRELTDDEKQMLKEKLGWSDKKIEDNCRIDKDGVIQYKTDCQDKEGITSMCGVPYERKRIEYNGVKIEGVFPIFNSVFDTKLDEKDYKSSNGKQFSECNKKLKETIENDSELREQFTDEQLDDIENGRTPRGYTWHHSEEPGKMQLVKTEDHDKRIGGAAHTGGNSIWGNTSIEKYSDDNAQKGESF